MSTIRDVAERAGVSTMTVSRVINNSGYFSREARERVEAAIAELGYVPNTLARSLRFKQTKTIALVLTDITNPFFTTLARGAEDVASEEGFNVIFCNTDESEGEQARELTVLVQKRVDGVLLVPAASSAEPVAFLREQGVPVVVLDRRVPDCTVDSVRCDSEQGAYELVKLLLGLGHTRIAALSGPEKVSTAQDRVAGYRRALAESGLGPGAEIVRYGPFTQAGGNTMARQVLALSPRPTALLAANNFIAVGAYQAVREAGLSVPEDVSIVGFDDLPAWLTMEPFLTVAAQPAYEMGQRATRMLLDRLGREAPPECREVVLPFELIVRRSSGPPRADAPMSFEARLLSKEAGLASA
jgi:LacI family transcriptional regulator